MLLSIHRKDPSFIQFDFDWSHLQAHVEKVQRIVGGGFLSYMLSSKQQYQQAIHYKLQQYTSSPMTRQLDLTNAPLRKSDKQDLLEEATEARRGMIFERFALATPLPSINRFRQLNIDNTDLPHQDKLSIVQECNQHLTTVILQKFKAQNPRLPIATFRRLHINTTDLPLQDKLRVLQECINHLDTLDSILQQFRSDTPRLPIHRFLRRYANDLPHHDKRALLQACAQHLSTLMTQRPVIPDHAAIIVRQQIPPNPRISTQQLLRVPPSITVRTITNPPATDTPAFRTPNSNTTMINKGNKRQIMPADNDDSTDSKQPSKKSKHDHHDYSSDSNNTKQHTKKSNHHNMVGSDNTETSFDHEDDDSTYNLIPHAARKPKQTQMDSDASSHSNTHNKIAATLSTVPFDVTTTTKHIDLLNPIINTITNDHERLTGNTSLTTKNLTDYLAALTTQALATNKHA